MAGGNMPDPYVAPPLSCANVNAERDRRLAAGFADAVTGKTWQCDALSQGKWTAIGASAGLAMVMQIDPPPTFELIAADNSIVTLSALEAFTLTNGRIMPWVSATMLYARAMKNLIAAETPPADIAAGWP
ncbi:MAG TPA: hypothetical protein VII92_14810 [Anaerolineae bacterium]